MSFSLDLLTKFVESKKEDGGAKLSSYYLDEELSGLNADQIARLSTELWHDFCRSQSEPTQVLTEEELVQRFGEWVFARGGMVKVEVSMDGNRCRVERFCGGWTLHSDETAAFIEGLYDAAPPDKRP